MRSSEGEGWAALLAPSVTTPQHVVGAFLAFCYLIHAWPIFKVSLLEVFGFKMFQGNAIPNRACSRQQYSTENF